MSARVAVPIYPGTNSEDETLRALAAVGLDARLVHWSEGAVGLRGYDAFVLPGGFAYEDRVRAGAVAAHDPMTDAIVEAAEAGKFVVGICNGAQILLETGLVPGTGPLRRPTAAFAPNGPSGRFRCVHVHVKLQVPPARSPLFAGLAEGAVIPMWAAHGEGRLAATEAETARLDAEGFVAFRYCDRDGLVSDAVVPNQSALGCAGLVNARGNVLAIMPHAERDAWAFMHRDGAARAAARGSAAAMLAPSGGIALFRSLAVALGVTA
jgi:phosphoribosylformylglycinamidine synthase